MKRLLLVLIASVISLYTLAQCPNTFSINTTSGNFSLACNPSLLIVNAVNTSTVSGMTYTWTGPITNTVGNTVGLAFPGAYTVKASSSTNTCITTTGFNVSTNSAAVSTSLNPYISNAICNGPPISFTAICSSTTNAIAQIVNDDGIPLTPFKSLFGATFGGIIFSTNNPGLYHAVFTNTVTGCVNIASKIINSSTIVPSMSLTASPSTTLTCGSGPIVLNIVGSTSISPITYTWTNMTTSVSVYPPTGAYSITSPGIYQAERKDGNGCTISLPIYIADALSNPTINISGTNTVCLGTTANLSVSVTGATNYTWSTGATTNTINVLPTSNTNYSVTAVNGICSSTSLIAVNVNTACADVWPGDANSDGVVSTLDILEIGTHFGNSGPGRSVVSNNWTPYFANVWTGTLSTGKNECHSDCNGDGVINNADTVAVKSNFSLTHSFKLENQNALSADLMITPDQPVIGVGMWGTASVYLGSSSSPISNIYGLAFNVTYDNALLETDSCYMSFTNSFLNASGGNIQFQKNLFSGGINYVASVRTDLNNVNGFGKIASLHYKSKSTLSSDATLNIGVSNAQMVSITGMPVTLTSSGTNSLTISTTFAGIKEFNYASNSIYLYPQPASNSFIIQMGEFKAKEVNIVIADLLGKTVVNTINKVENDRVLVPTVDLNSGTYFVSIINSEGISTNKKLIVSK